MICKERDETLKLSLKDQTEFSQTEKPARAFQTEGARPTKAKKPETYQTSCRVLRREAGLTHGSRILRRLKYHAKARSPHHKSSVRKRPD